jgi:hypothetical protein
MESLPLLEGADFYSFFNYEKETLYNVRQQDIVEQFFFLEFLIRGTIRKYAESFSYCVLKKY